MRRVRAPAIPRPSRSVCSEKKRMTTAAAVLEEMEAARARAFAGERAGERPAARDQRARRGAPAGAAKPRDRVRPPAAHKTNATAFRCRSWRGGRLRPSCHLRK